MHLALMGIAFANTAEIQSKRSYTSTCQTAAGMGVEIAITGSGIGSGGTKNHCLAATPDFWKAQDCPQTLVKLGTVLGPIHGVEMSRS
jgi:hypothetical protein